ncbi:MAG: hypothetical protein CVV41_21770 [Candidatus Riflebacteria bacterium HGW-Riflebacteria-1]|jgi:hypothetical protein|nr:MAG: hypothetical protein CVV41_21770 [Candidatus Riflebacteria bacterium HGW-Riflebacteria-1]
MTEELHDNEQIEKIGRDTYQAIINILTESPFFYADDDPPRFTSLRRHKSAFERFFSKFFGWRLYVDAKMARLIRDRNFNEALRPSHQRYFNLTSRLECVLFLVLLEFYEHEGDQQNFSYEESQNLRFTYGSYYGFCRMKLDAQLGEGAPSDRILDQETRALLSKLETYRLLRIIETGQDNSAECGPELLIEALPGLSCYEGAKMADSIIRKSFGVDKDDFADANCAAPAEDNGDAAPGAGPVNGGASDD